MTVQITPDLRIVLDKPGQNWSVEKFTPGGKHPITGKIGAPGWRQWPAENWHGSLHLACRWLLMKWQPDANPDLAGYVRHMDDCETRIMDAVKRACSTPSRGVLAPISTQDVL